MNVGGCCAPGQPISDPVALSAGLPPLDTVSFWSSLILRNASVRKPLTRARSIDDDRSAHGPVAVVVAPKALSLSQALP
jgi:hypothetical protein